MFLRPRSCVVHTSVKRVFFCNFHKLVPSFWKMSTTDRFPEIGMMKLQKCVFAQDMYGEFFCVVVTYTHYTSVQYLKMWCDGDKCPRCYKEEYNKSRLQDNFTYIWN